MSSAIFTLPLVFILSFFIPRTSCVSDNDFVTRFPVYRGANTSEEFIDRLCHERCNGTVKVNKFHSRPWLHCYPCRCTPSCRIEGVCCPKVGQAWLPPPVDRSQCRSDFEGNKVLHVVKCDPKFPSGNGRDLCESRTLPRKRDTVLPVTSASTQVTYANKHCAACNYDDEDAVEWDVRCHHSQFLYDAANDAQYEERAIQMPGACGFTRGGHFYDVARGHECACEHSKFGGDAISSCNVTGRWAEGDEDVQKACEEWDRSRGAFVREGWQLYSNAFCAMCNEDGEFSRDPGSTFNTFECEVRPTRTHTQLLRPVSRDSLIPSAIDLREQIDCPEGQWSHPQGKCLELQCAAGKTLEEGHCKTVVKRVTGLGYRLHIVLRPVRLQYRQDNMTATTTTTTTVPWGDQPSQRQLMNCHYGKTLGQTMKKRLDRISDDLSMNITTAGTTNESCFAETYRDELERLTKHDNATNGHFPMFDLDVEDFASNEARFLRAEVEAYILAGRSIGARDTEEDGIAFYVFDKVWKVKLGKWSLWLKVFDTSTKLLYGGKKQTDLAVFGRSDVEITTVPYWSDTWPLIRLEHLFLPLTNALLCPHLYFERDEFTLVTCDECEAQVKFPYFLDSDQKPLSFLAKHYPNGAWLTEGGQLMMCEDTFLRVFPQNVTVVKSMTTQRQPPSMVHLILSAVCGSVSVVCLVVTFTTYALFQELRNLPGLNNMGLSLSLVTAQLSLLLPLDRTGVVWVCRAVGVFTHWAWLTVLGWMGVCCVHMVRVFTSKTRRSLTYREAREVFLRYVLITCLFSTAIVVITIAVSSAVSGGASVGYGGAICFLDTELHRLLLLAFLLPLGLVVLTNLTCFAITVVAIVRVRRLQARAPREWRDILVFVKLVTATGGSWLLGLLAELTDQEWMRVVADLCIAAQGLLLFLAYTCNKRVWRLYRARFHGLRRATPPDTGSTPTPAIALTYTPVKSSEADA